MMASFKYQVKALSMFFETRFQKSIFSLFSSIFEKVASEKVFRDSERHFSEGIEVLNDICVVRKAR